MAVDPKRNEVTLQLAGETRTLRATFEAIRCIERDLGKSIVAAVGDLGAGDVSMTATAAIIFHGLVGADDKRLTIQEVGNAIIGEPFKDASYAAAQFLQVALVGPSLGKPEEMAAA